MFKQLGNIASLLKQAQSLGGQMGELGDELKSKRVTGTAGGGMVTVTANGVGVVLSVEIDQLLRDKGDMEMLQDLLPAAINDALGKAKALHVEAMQEMTGGLTLPDGLENAMKQMMSGGGADNPLDDSPSTESTETNSDDDDRLN